ncbi:MAG: hemerythrin domain-containing protein [Pseudomonadota bacterium]
MNTDQRAHLRGRLAKRAAPSRPMPDAISRIAAEHAELQQMFTAFENTRSVNNKRFLVERICTTVVVDAQVKEEIFYPAVEAVMPQPAPPHDAMKALVAHIKSLEPVAELVDGPIQVLAEEVKQHVSTLHEDMLPRVKASRIDLVELGERMARRKAELIAQNP